MKSFRIMIPVLGIVATLAGAGCSGTEGTNTGTSANAISATSPAEQAKDQGAHVHRRHGRPGPEMLVFAALHENINLTPEQRTTIEGLVTKRGPGEERGPDKAKTAELAAAIRAGNVGTVDVQAKHGNRSAELATKLGTLHDTLTKEQRAALVDAIVAKQGQHRERAQGEKRERAEKGEGMGPMGHLLEGLDLTQAQKDQIEAKLEADRPAKPNVDFAALKKEMDAKLQTFKDDSFDANAFVTPPANAPKFERGADFMAKRLQVVVSVLDQNQREKLAQKIEQGPQMRQMHQIRR